MAFSVLIVDDNMSFLQAARVLLEQEGLRVVGVAASSAEALRRARSETAGSAWTTSPIDEVLTISMRTGSPGALSDEP